MDERIWHKAYADGVPPAAAYGRWTLPQLFERSAERYPDASALSFLNCTLTYRQLRREIDRLATGLAGLGVDAEDRVAIHLPNLPQTVIAFFATLKLGAQAVMTNPLYMPPEIEHQWNDAGCRVAVAADFLYDQKLRGIRDRLPIRHYVIASVPEYLRFPLKQLAPLKLKRAAPPLIAHVQPDPSVHAFRRLIESSVPCETTTPGFDDVALLQYTGGTTGLSKGAMLTHENLSCNAQQIRTWFPNFVDGKEVILAALPFFHIFGITVAMLLAISTGGCMILMPNPRDIPAMVKSISRKRVTLFPGVPAMFNAINQYPKIDKVDITCVKSCFSGSAPLPLAVVERFEKLTGSRIVEGYGLTESSPVTHVNPLGGIRKLGSIGIPIPDTDARVVDAETGERELPAGEEGELIVRGPQIMKGYWNRSKETDDVLRDGWLFTGDLAAMDDDGYFTIVGRKKDMILASGYNVYPDEIDDVIMTHEAVLEACTIGVPDPKRGETVKSYVVKKPNAEVTADEIIAYCRQRLAAYKAPRLVEFRAELPKSSMLKLLRRVLRDEEMVRMQKETQP